MNHNAPCAVIHDYTRLPCPRAALTAAATRIAAAEDGRRRRAVNCICCSDYKIRKLNRDYRTIDRATDVLAFPFDEPDFLGEIYISLQRAAVQARRYGHSYDQELLRLFVHGYLHLLGYDHHDEKQRRRMEEREARYCGEIADR
jgi:probable rRNA maturation factor